MSWSFKLVRAFGVDVRVHALFVLLLLWQGGVGLARTGTVGGLLSALAFVLALFALIVAHELGHALAARRFGIRTVDITLLPIGGVARLERMPEKPAQELAVAIAGPAVNVVLAAALAVVHVAAGLPFVPRSEPTPLLTGLFYANVGLALFNLLPAFPLDGGRVLRALLSLRGGRLRATRIAARMGQGLAMFLGLVGGFSSAMLVVLAIFIWVGAAAELDAVELRASLRGVPLESAMLKACDPLWSDDSLDAAARLTIAHGHRDFPVVDGAGRVVGVLTGRKLVEGLALLGPATPVGQAMDARIEFADVTEPLDDALAKLEASPSGVLVVLGNGGVQGLVTRETIEQLASLRSAAAFAREHGPSRVLTPRVA